MATHSSILAWRIPWTEELGGLQSMGLQRVRNNWSHLARLCTLLDPWYSTHSTKCPGAKCFSLTVRWTVVFLWIWTTCVLLLEPVVEKDVFILYSWWVLPCGGWFTSQTHQALTILFCGICNFFKKFIYFRLCWNFIIACGLPLFVVHRLLIVMASLAAGHRLQGA